MRLPPPGVFSEVHILKGFKSCVLEMRIPKGLRVCFEEVRILRDLAQLQGAGEEKRKTVETARRRVGTRRQEEGNAVTESAQRGR
jgi:hypothetical protein